MNPEDIIKRYREINKKLEEIIQRLTNTIIVSDNNKLDEMLDLRKKVKELNEEKKEINGKSDPK